MISGCSEFSRSTGAGQSGNGTREPGTEALDVYSELKDVCIHVNPQAL
jgi:aldehyde dehydrogenase (NAD+)